MIELITTVGINTYDKLTTEKYLYASYLALYIVHFLINFEIFVEGYKICKFQATDC